MSRLNMEYRGGLFLQVLALASFFALSLAGIFAVIMTQHPLAPWMAILSNIVLAAPVLYGFLSLNGRQGWLQLIGLTVFAYFIESLGVSTGFPYGRFYYGDHLGPLVFSGVPIILPLSWIPLVIGAKTLANLTCSQGHWIKVSCLSAIYLVFLDLLLDPVAAKLGYWTWPNGVWFMVYRLVILWAGFFLVLSAASLFQASKEAVDPTCFVLECSQALLFGQQLVSIWVSLRLRGLVILG